MPNKPSPEKIAALLDSKRISPPAVFYPTGKQRAKSLLFPSFKELLAHPDSAKNDHVLHFLDELANAKNPKLWGLFVRNNGHLRVPLEGEESSISGVRINSYNNEIVDKNKPMEKRVIPHITYTLTADDDPYNLFHELGHMIDDQTYHHEKAMIKPPSQNSSLDMYEAKYFSHEDMASDIIEEPIISDSMRQWLESKPKDISDINLGFHSGAKAWKWLVGLDKSIYTVSDIAQTEVNRKRSDYAPSDPEWKEEIFAEAVNRHMGTAKHLAKGAVLSPLIQAYMDQVVGLDIAIQMQNKPYYEIQQDRGKLLEVLQKPASLFFDVDKIAKQQKIINSAKSKPVKEAATKILEGMVEEGLHTLAATAAKEVGIAAPPLGKRRRT